MINYISNLDGPTLGYSTSSGISILEEAGFYFKDLNKSGKLEPYKDWRLSSKGRAVDLAARMTIEQIAGLMLYSRHQSIPADSKSYFTSTYKGKKYEESGAKEWDLSDQQKEFLIKDNVRHVLITTVKDPKTAARWNNELQLLTEGIGMGIPANNSSDPRHGSDSSKEFNEGAGGLISMWPENLGLAATFNPSLIKKFGEIAAKEYRALGLTTTLSPQIDLATDPRWYRYSGTFGEDAQLTTDLARAYIDGFQSSSYDSEISGGWGYESVNAMVKHWPGGGSGEGGRDAHWGYGKYAVYPGDNFDEHLNPFIDGAFKLDGKTKIASAVMPYYTISLNQDKVNKENVGNSYNSYLINDLLRGKYQYEGVVCTDWLITADEPETVDLFDGKPWGVEHLSVVERHYKLIMAGVDQFGGNNKVEPVIEAYKMGVEEHGETYMRNRFEQSAIKLLENIFRTGLFENPYLEVEKSSAIVGHSSFIEEGYKAQIQSVVLLKNKKQLLPLKERKTVFIPKRYYPERLDWFGNVTPDKTDYPINMEIAEKYFNVTDNPAEADFAFVYIHGPESGRGYSKEDREKGGNGYVPISLQYRPYQAKNAREESLGVDIREAFNRSYKDKMIKTTNESDLDLVLETKKKMGNKPVIVSMLLSNPAIVREFENKIDVLLVQYGVQDQALFEIMTGKEEPSGLLPMQLPKDMETVEVQLEDVSHDMEPYEDTEGNEYDFAFGLNWSGIISDERTERYKK